MSGEPPKPIDDASGATSPSHAASGRATGVRPPPLKVDMSKVPEPRWLKHSVTAIDIFAGVLCAIVVRWMGGLPLSFLRLPTDWDLPYWLLVVALAGIGWFIRRRAWAIAFVAGTIAIPLGLLRIG